MCFGCDKNLTPPTEKNISFKYENSDLENCSFSITIDEGFVSIKILNLKVWALFKYKVIFFFVKVSDMPTTIRMD